MGLQSCLVVIPMKFLLNIPIFPFFPSSKFQEFFVDKSVFVHVHFAVLLAVELIVVLPPVLRSGEHRVENITIVVIHIPFNLVIHYLSWVSILDRRDRPAVLEALTDSIVIAHCILAELHSVHSPVKVFVLTINILVDYASL